MRSDAAHLAQCGRLPGLMLPALVALLLAASIAPAAAGQPLPNAEAVLDSPDAPLPSTSDAEAVLGWCLDGPDLSHATAEQLARLPGIDAVLAAEVVAFRKASSGVVTPADLHAASILPADANAALRACFAPTAPQQHRRVPVRYRATQRSQWRSRNGASYQLRLDGSPDSTLYWHLLLDSDAGERIRWDPATHTYGFDFTSLSLAYRPTPRFEVIAGDYAARFGQGLALWSAMSRSGLGYGVSGVLRHADALAPYTSSDEDHHLRGIAATFRPGSALAVTMLASRRLHDARTLGRTDSLYDGDLALSGTYGLHRTLAERERKGRIAATTGGVMATLTYRRLETGTAALVTRYVPALSAGPDTSLRDARNASLSARWSSRKATLSFEGAVDGGGRTAFVAGAQVRAARSADVLAHVRRYTPGYTALLGSGPAAHSDAQNEAGAYLALRLRPTPALTLTASADAFRTLQPQGRVPFGEHGTRSSATATYAPYAWLQLAVRAQHEAASFRDSLALPPGGAIARARTRTRDAVRADLTYDFSRTLQLRSRADAVATRRVRRGYGMLLQQQVRWQASRTLSVSGSIAAFDADAYDARLYTVERDVLYTFAATMLTGTGQRLYAMLDWQPVPAVRLQLKAATTSRESGLLSPERRYEVHTTLQVAL